MQFPTQSMRYIGQSMAEFPDNTRWRGHVTVKRPFQRLNELSEKGMVETIINFLGETFTHGSHSITSALFTLILPQCESLH
jgi:hypothetical protein